MTDAIRYDAIREHRRFHFGAMAKEGITVTRWVRNADLGGSEDGTPLATFYGVRAEQEAARYIKRQITLDTGQAVKAKYDAMTTPEAAAKRCAAKARRSPYAKWNK